MHGAKGLEFHTVFVIAANEDICPYKKAETTEEVEEERRLFYVAMTRAKKRLVISYSKERNGKKMKQSKPLSVNTIPRITCSRQRTLWRWALMGPHLIIWRPELPRRKP
jgi:superfamily I DNA/RNA helicase